MIVKIKKREKVAANNQNKYEGLLTNQHKSYSAFPVIENQSRKICKTTKSKLSYNSNLNRAEKIYEERKFHIRNDRNFEQLDSWTYILSLSDMGRT